MNTIISKRTTPFVYTAYISDPKRNVCEVKYSIVINGGAGVAGGSELLSGLPMSQRSLFVPEGVATLVDDDTLNKLMAIPKFRSDIKRGLIIVRKREKITSQDKIDNIAEKDMLEGDHIPTRPITQKDFEAAGAKVVEDNEGNKSLNITKLACSPILKRNAEAGLPGYVKKRRRGKAAGVITSSVVKQ